MLKLRVITPLCVLFVLQVFSDEASQPKLCCASLCDQVDFGYAGICCGHEYCDCDSGSDIPLVCPTDELFCDAIGDCVHIFGQQCSEAEYCCAAEKPTTTMTTTTKTTTTTTKPDTSYAVLITGGYNSPRDTAELYQPSSSVSCSLPQLPDLRYYHTVESSGLLCGGYYTRDTCLQWSPDTGAWDLQLTLDVKRDDHVSWTPGTEVGTYLMGGSYSGSERTTTLIKPDGSQEPGFDLKYDTDQACAIPDKDTGTIIITGGRYTPHTVSVYSVEGWQQDLPPLNTGRRYHACSSYWSGERRVFMVTGGYTGSDRLDSTETFTSDEDSWTTTGAKLPQPMSGLRAANIDDRILIFGGRDGRVYDDILEYNPNEDSMVVVGHLTQARGYHAVSVVQAQDFSVWCQ